MDGVPGRRSAGPAALARGGRAAGMRVGGSAPAGTACPGRRDADQAGLRLPAEMRFQP